MRSPVSQWNEANWVWDPVEVCLYFIRYVHRLFTWKLSTFLCPRRYWQYTIVDVIYLLLSIIHCCCRLVERVWLLTYLFGSCYFVVFQLFKTGTGFWGMRLWRRDCLLFDVVILSMSYNNTWKITKKNTTSTASEMGAGRERRMNAKTKDNQIFPICFFFVGAYESGIFDI